MESPNKGDTLGADNLSFIEKLSFGGRLNNTKSIQMVPWRVSFIEKLSSGGRVHYRRFHCIAFHCLCSPAIVCMEGSAYSSSL